MQGPTGCSGVQAARKSSHSAGVLTPRRMAPQMQPFGSRARPAAMSKRLAASKRAYDRPEPQPAGRHLADAPPVGLPDLEDGVHELERRRVALRPDAAAVGVLDLRPAAFDLLDEAVDGQEDIQRLEAGDGAGDAVVRGEELVRAGADDGADVAGADDAVEADLAEVEDGLHDGRADLVEGEDVVVM